MHWMNRTTNLTWSWMQWAKINVSRILHNREQKVVNLIDNLTLCLIFEVLRMLDNIWDYDNASK